MYKVTFYRLIKPFLRERVKKEKEQKVRIRKKYINSYIFFKKWHEKRKNIMNVHISQSETKHN